MERNLPNPRRRRRPCRVAPLALTVLILSPAPPAVTAASEAPPDTVQQSAAVLGRFTPAELELGLAERPEQALEVLLVLGAGLEAAPEPLARRLQEFLAATARERGRRLAERGPPWSEAEIETLLVLLLVDPPRFTADTGFRERVVPVIERGLDPRAPEELRDRLLYALNRVRGLPFRHAERVALAWGAIDRSSQPFRVVFDPGTLTPNAPDRAIEASLYSFSSAFFSPADVVALLREVRRLAPRRRLLVLCDRTMRAALESHVDELGLTLFETFGRPFSPWVRDVLSLRRRPDGRVVLVLRPDTQIGREQDAHMGQVLLQQLPRDLLSGWLPAWAASPTPFHNGQILDTGDSAWISLHSLRAQLRRLTGVEWPPTEGAPPQPAGSVLDSARDAAAELEELLGKPARFVHPLEAAGGPGDVVAPLLGGAPFDLDSVLTILPGEPHRALVGDLERGHALTAALDGAELERLGQAFGLRSRGEDLRRALADAQREPRALELQRFVDTIARHLEGESIRVERLPLLRVPHTLMSRARVERDFLLGWNNVTLEYSADGWRAEGFSSLLTSGDAAARTVFDRNGVRLDLLPPLIESITRNGGYRCASNHLRAAPPSTGR